MKSLALLIVILISFEITSAVENRKIEQILTDPGVTNWGKEFYLTFLPCWETSGGSSDKAIYVSSNCRTRVTVEVPGKGYSQVQYTEPNGIIQFSLGSSIAQPYRKTDRDMPQPDQVWKSAGIRVIADDPIICYAISINENSSEGFLVLPIHSLGKSYIVSSFADIGNNTNRWFPSYSAIVGIHDGTTVDFTMGGNDWTTTVNGQKPGETTTWRVDEGDVLLFAGLGDHSELTGSKISSSKPVAAVSGNFCTYVPTNTGRADLLQEMEISTEKWGKIYHVSPMSQREKSSIIKIFAKEDNTKVFLDGNQIGFIKSSCGVEGVGYLHLRASTEGNVPVVVSGDKPISVTQFNTGRNDDGAGTDPFQMVLVPVEQYQKEMTFMVAGEPGEPLAPMQYLNLIYQATPWGTIPEDLELATFENEKYEWRKLIDIDGSPGMPFEKIGNQLYYSKSILMTDPGSYKIRCSNPFGAYIYSISRTVSYGFPAAVNLRIINSTDTLPPEPIWQMCCLGDINNPTCCGKGTGVFEMPNIPSERSNLSQIYIHNNESYNYELWHDEIIPCETNEINWGLNVIDWEEDAFAAVTFVDCAGNDTTLHIKYTATKVSLIGETWNAGLHAVGDTSWQMFHIINNGSAAWEVTELSLKQKDLKGDPQGFSIWNEDRTGPLQFPLSILSQDSLHFQVKFDATQEGTFWDSIGYGDTNFFFYKAYVEAVVGTPYIQSTDWTFPDTKIGAASYGQFEISNRGSVNLLITEYKGPFRRRQDNQTIFLSEDLENISISAENPLIIPPNEFRNFEITFMPDNEGSYHDSICFSTNAKEYDLEIDSVVRITGIGIPTISVQEFNNDEDIIIIPNPATDYIEIKLRNVETALRPVSEVVEIFDVLGQTVAKQSFNKKTLLSRGGWGCVMDVSHLQPGIYFIRAGNEFLKFVKI